MNVLKCFGAAMCMFAATQAVRADVIANWTFETNLPATPVAPNGTDAGPFAAELGGNAATSQARAHHASSSTVWSNVTGNGSAKSFSANNWAVGDYWQFATSTTGYNTITFKWDQTGSGTGPRDFTFWYSLNGTAFTQVGGTLTVLVNGSPNTAWNATTSSAVYSFTVNAPVAVDNQATVTFRIVDAGTTAINGTTVGTGGTDRVDNVIISGTATGAPTGACCNPDGTCTDSVAQGACAGTYNGDGILCSAVTCVATQGACCNASGGGCSIVNSSAACTTLNPLNAFLGASSVCGASNVNCPNGACCQTSGACSTTLLAGCTGTSTFTANTACNPCEQPAACCNPSTGVCTLAIQSVCTGAGNTYNGAVACSNVTPFTCNQPSGACCDTRASACRVTAANDCAANGFFGGTTTCTAVVSCTPPQVVISQIYGGGGNSGATFTNDFVELFNRGHTPVNLAGWSIQYAGNTGTQWTPTALTNFVLQPGQYYLIQLAAGTTVINNPLPVTAEVSNASVNMSATAGKVALSRISSAITGGCASTAGVVADFVGFGSSADCREGTLAANNAPAPADNAKAMFRNSSGCADTNVNSADFLATASPAPRNTSTISECAVGNPPSGVGSANPNPACQGTLVTFTVTTTDGSDPVGSVTGDFSAIAGNNPEFFTNSGLNTWTFQLTIGNIAQQLWNVPITITDNGGRTANTNIAFTVSSCNSTLTSATADPNYACNGSQARLFVTATPGPNSSHANFVVSANLTSVSTSAANPAVFTRVGLTNVYEYFVTIDNPAVITGPHVLAVNLIDNAVAADTANLTLTTAPCTNSTSKIVISQVFGGGGNNGSIYGNDYVELFNRSGVAVSIDGWSLQYGSDTDGGFSGSIGSGANANAPVPLSGTIQPGKYYLIQLAAGANATGALPTPDALGVPAIPLSSSAGRIALVRNSIAPLGVNAVACGNSSIEDFIGYAPTAECFEGDSNLGPTAALDNTKAAFRRIAGCQDTDRNIFDFTLGAPAPRNSATPANNCVPVLQVGSCCLTDGSCVAATPGLPAQCASGNLTVNGTCTPNICPQPAAGVCCRGATCSTAFADATACSAPFATSATGGPAWAFVITALSCNVGVLSDGNYSGPINVASPCCFANYNHSAGGLEVQDIFDFLNDWFAGRAIAIPGGDGASLNGLAVQNIFNFLNAWFAGGCS